MAFRNAQQARAYVGQLAAAAYADTASASALTGVLECTTLADGAKTFIIGHGTSTFDIAGPIDVDATADEQYDVIKTLVAKTTPTPITYMPLGTDGAAWLTEADQTDFTTSADNDGVSRWSMAAQTTGRTDYNGTILSNNEAITVTVNGATIDQAAATADGAVFNLHVTAWATLTSNDITIEDSATGSSGWATIATFAQYTGLTSERVEITGAVKRYVRVVDTVVGSGSTSRLISMSRR